MKLIKDNIWIYCFLIFLIETWESHQDESVRSKASEPQCPRIPKLAKRRKCLKKCETDMNCKSKTRRCLCDGVCGKSCVKPNKKCGALNNITNGEFEISPFNKFGAKLKYICNKGYTLSGNEERVCQGDGSWNGTKPICKTGDSCRLPKLTNGEIITEDLDETIHHGASIRYTCDPGFRPIHDTSPSCYNGSLTFKPTCVPVYCKHPGVLEHGEIFLLGVLGKYIYKPYVKHVRENDQIEYHCNNGFKTEGPMNATCVNGMWFPEGLPICAPVYCKYPGMIENGEILLIGTLGKYVYKPYMTMVEQNDEIEYLCNKGFKQEGPVNAMCKDGMWSPQEMPICVPAQHHSQEYLDNCTLPNTDNGKVITEEVDEPISP